MPPAASLSRRIKTGLSGKVFIKTYGCQMNVYDSGRMADILHPLGYRETDDPADADLVILNTCHIREKAAEKIYSELGRLRPLQARKAQAGGRMILAVGGCVAQAEGAEILARAPQVDLVFGPQTYHRLPEMLKRVGAGKLVDTDFPVEEKFDFLPQESARSGVTAFLTIQEGCDKFCAFCVVPYTRGAESSRPVAALLAEARRLADGGARELTLLGQNVNAWRGAGPDGSRWGLARLIAALAEIPGLARLRYTTSHPLDMDEELIAAHGSIPQLMPCLHLPVQSGSDRILAAMNRRHDAARYLDVVSRLRAARPDIVLSSDFIVGFPGETDADFAATVQLVNRVGFQAGAYSFKYSPRPGTPAAGLPQVPAAVADDRLKGLQQLLDAQREAFDATMPGRTVPVLFEKPGRRPGQIVGRSPWFQPVHADGAETLIGQIIPCHVTAAAGHGLFAAPVTAPQPSADDMQVRMWA